MDSKEHNNLIYKCYKGNPHLKHVLLSEDIQKMTMIEGRFPLTKLPVCSHCESLGLWHHDSQDNEIGVCTKCGTYTKFPMTYSEYLATGYDVDKTGETFRNMFESEKETREKNNLFYLPYYNIGKGGKS